MSQLEKAARAVAAGHLVVLPTDTVYGIGCDPYDSRAVTNLLAAKGRGQAMPPPVLAADPEQALGLLDWTVMTEAAQVATRRLAQACWPGALTLIGPTAKPFGWDMATHGATVAVRVPDEPLTRALLEVTGPLAVTSANATGQDPALTLDQARAYFGDAVACYLDGGRARVGEASTIIDCTAMPVRVIRSGALDWEKIQSILEDDEEPTLG